MPGVAQRQGLGESLVPLRGERLHLGHPLAVGLENWFGLEQGFGLTVGSKVNAAWPLLLSSTGWAWRGGPLGGALTDDGVNGTTGTFEAVGSAALGRTDLSFAGWVSLPATGLHGTFWKVGDSSHGFSLGVGASDHETGGNNILGLYENTRWINTSVAYLLGWHHYAFVVDSSGFPHIYLDGAAIYTDTTGAMTNFLQGGERYVGYSPASTTRVLAGTLGPFGFWRSRALSAADVALLARTPDVLYQQPHFWVLGPPAGGVTVQSRTSAMAVTAVLTPAQLAVRARTVTASAGGTLTSAALAVRARTLTAPAGGTVTAARLAVRVRTTAPVVAATVTTGQLAVRARTVAAPAGGLLTAVGGVPGAVSARTLTVLLQAALTVTGVSRRALRGITQRRAGTPGPDSHRGGTSSGGKRWTL